MYIYVNIYVWFPWKYGDAFLNALNLDSSNLNLGIELSVKVTSLVVAFDEVTIMLKNEITKNLDFG